MGHLFYNVLGGSANSDIVTTHNGNYDLFSNVQPFYWSATEFSPTDGRAWCLYFNSGQQVLNAKTASLYAWAVHSGDVGAVPVPAAV